MNWQNILKSKQNSSFQRFVIKIFGIPRAVARKLTPSRSLMNTLSKSGLAEAITENKFEELMNLAESEQYEALLKALEEINSRHVRLNPERQNKRKKERYANDPEFAEKLRRKNREAYRRRKERKE